MITTKQSNLLAYLDSYSKSSGGVAPSFNEMQEHLGLVSKSGVHRLLEGLEERGMIRRLKGKVRAIEVLRMPAKPDRAMAISLDDMAALVAAQPWCRADAATVLDSLKELRR